MPVGTGIIFIAVAIAWAAYLIPQALKFHEAEERTRAHEKLAETSRVVARREAVTSRSAVLVTGDAAATLALARRDASRRATMRRRRALSLIVLSGLVMATIAAFGVVSWWWMGAPGGLLVIWLIACRLMVRSERRAWDTVGESAHEEIAEARPVEPAVPAPTPVAETPPAEGLWEPVAVTLPTYVSAPVARRAVRPIDLDSTGVWSSGRSRDLDEAARIAEEFRAAAAEADEELNQRAVGE